MIKPSNHSLSVTNTEPLDEKKYLFFDEKEEKEDKEDDEHDEHDEDNQLILFTGDKKSKKKANTKIELVSNDENSIVDDTVKKQNEKEIQDIELKLEIENLHEKIDENEENNNELKEIDSLELSLENDLEIIQLKKPNQVYFELYKEARKKAKEAKKNAILAYLEAKNIKKNYMIDNLNDSDSDNDIDEEIEAVSDSELEGL